MKFAALMLCICVLCGCSAETEPIDRALDLRNALLSCRQCTFSSVISADYGERIDTFQLDCSTNAEGIMTFTVTDPETIRGIGGIISEEGGSLCFDDKVLAFPMLANDQLPPVSTPWIFLNALKSGYINGCSREGEGICIYLDDSFENAFLRVEVITDSENTPIHTDIYWNQKRILSADIRNFNLL